MQALTDAGDSVRLVSSKAFEPMNRGSVACGNLKTRMYQRSLPGHLTATALPCPCPRVTIRSKPGCRSTGETLQRAPAGGPRSRCIRNLRSRTGSAGTKTQCRRCCKRIAWAIAGTSEMVRQQTRRPDSWRIPHEIAGPEVSRSLRQGGVRTNAQDSAEPPVGVALSDSYKRIARTLFRWTSENTKLEQPWSRAFSRSSSMIEEP